MIFKFSRKLLISLGFMSAMVLSACEPGAVSTGGAVYYDSVLWNDYYYGGSRPGYRPPHGRPDRPDRPVRPERPVRPGGGGFDPGFSRPPGVSRPIHRPAGGGGFRGGGRLR